MVSKLWYQYNHDEDFGKFPDPLGRYPKPDANFYGIPQGTPITVLPGGDGTVTDVRSVNWDTSQATSVITIQFDSPPNSVAKYYAYSFVVNPAVSVGQHVKPGDTVAFRGSGNIGVAYAFSSVSRYGESSSAEPFSGTFVSPELSPVSYLRSIQTGVLNMPTIILNAFVSQVLADLKGGSFDTTPNTVNFFLSWCHMEGGGVTNKCKFNPLNTMQDESGATQCPGTLPGIKLYPDDGTGIKATVDALNNGRYPSLVHALTTSDENNLGFNAANTMAANIAEDLTTWVSGKRTPIDINYVFRIMAGAGISNARIQGVNGTSNIQASTDADRTNWGNVSLGTDTSGVTTGGAVQNTLASVNSFFASLTSFFSNPVRFIKIVIGFLLIVVGSILLVKEMIPANVKKVTKDVGFPLA